MGGGDVGLGFGEWLWFEARSRDAELTVQESHPDRSQKKCTRHRICTGLCADLLKPASSLWEN